MTDTWGMLPKAQDDNQTIDEAIDAAITAHEADSEAHQGAGESLESHRTEEVIDHPAESLIEDKYSDNSIQETKLIRNKLCVDTNWETTDAYYKTIASGGAIQPEVGSLLIKSSNVNGEYTEIKGESVYIGSRISDGNPNFETTMHINSTTSQNIYIGCGWQEDEFIGFYIDGATLYACLRPEGISHNTEIQTLTLHQRYNLRVKITSGVKAEFYVDETLVHTDTTYTPDFYDSEALFNFYVKTTTNSYRSIVVYRTTYYQDLRT